MKKNIIIPSIVFLLVLSIGSVCTADLGDVDIHGFISQGYLQTDRNQWLAETENGSFQFNEMGINFSSELTDELRMGLQLFARDLGKVGNDDIVLDWCFGDYRYKDWLGFRFGKVKMNNGLYGEVRDMDMLRTSVFLPQSVYTELWRDSLTTIKGGSIYGDIALGALGVFSYDAQYGVGIFDKNSGFTKAFDINLYYLDVQTTDGDIDNAYSYKLQWSTPVPGLTTQITYWDLQGIEVFADWNEQTVQLLYGFQGITIPDASSMHYEVKRLDAYISSIEYTYENFMLSAEWYYGHLNGLINKTIKRELPQNQWYVAASYRFTDWFELGVNYAEYHKDDNNRNKLSATDQLLKENVGLIRQLGFQYYPLEKYEQYLKTTTISTRFDVNEYWTIKFEGSHCDGFGSFSFAQDYQTDDRPAEKWFLFAAKVTYNF